MRYRLFNGHSPAQEKVMQTNVGTADKVIRIVIGVGLLSLVFILEGNVRWFGLIGIMPIFTALMGWCPAYTLLGIRTCPLSGKKE